MKTLTNVSGGRSSAYIAANYPADYLVFALVRSKDKSIAYKDPYLKKWTEDKIQKTFVATLEDDIIIQTLYELEQFLGRSITFVSDITFDTLIEQQRVLPNASRRFCTAMLKVRPIFNWWRINIKTPIIANVGYRANEGKRVIKMQERLNENGLIEQPAVIGKSATGRRKWKNIEWQKPQFPLYDDEIYHEDIIDYWSDKPVKFAEISNCVGCFHKRIKTLRHQAIHQPAKFEWFAKQDRKNKKSSFLTNISYDDIKKIPEQKTLFGGSGGHCDSGFCGY